MFRPALVLPDMAAQRVSTTRTAIEREGYSKCLSLVHMNYLQMSKRTFFSIVALLFRVGPGKNRKPPLPWEATEQEKTETTR